MNNLLMACLCMFAASASPQSQSAATSPIAGVWTGEMVASDGNKHAITVELHVDANAVVSGTVSGPQLTPGDIAGTFDAKTGALRFEVTVRSGGLKVQFDGAVAHDTISGKVTAPEVSGTFRITKQSGLVAVTPPPGAGARLIVRTETGADSAVAAVRRGFTEVSGWITRAAELVPPDKYTYRPAQTVRTFGQMVAHVVDGYNYYCGRAAGRSVQWSDAAEKGTTTKAALQQKLKQSLDGCTAAYAGASQIGPLMENIAHTNLHYGNIVTYMRMLGLTPPSS